MAFGALPSPSTRNVRRSCSLPATSLASAKGDFTEISSRRRTRGSTVTCHAPGREGTEMAVTLKDKMKSLSALRRKKVEARAAHLIAQEMTLQELRRARKITQVRIAKEL